MNRDNGGFDLPIRINYTLPALIFWFIYITHFGAIISINLTSLSLISKICLLLVVISSLAVSTYRLNQQQNLHEPFDLILNADDQWIVITSKRKQVYVRLIKASMLMQTLLVLVLAAENNKKYVFILTEDMVDKDTMRRLRVRLRYPKSILEQ